MQNRGIALAVPLLSCFLPTSAKANTMTMNFLRYESIIEMECVTGTYQLTHPQWIRPRDTQLGV